MNTAQRLGLRGTVITVGVALALVAVLVGLTPTVLAQSQSNDASLSGLTLSEVDFGTFASGTTSYTASVSYSVSQTTVAPTVNQSGASYVIKLGGVTDADGDISLAVGSNTITVEVTAEDGQATQTYTVIVTRAAASTDATLSSLSLNRIDFGTFESDTLQYTVQVSSHVDRTMVTLTRSHPKARYLRQARWSASNAPRDPPQRGKQRHHHRGHCRGWADDADLLRHRHPSSFL